MFRVKKLEENVVKKLDKNKKFMLAVGVAVLAIAIIFIWVVMTSSDNTKPVDNAGKDVSSEAGKDSDEPSLSPGKSVFYGCEGMVMCTLGEGMTAVAPETFTNCYKLEEVVLPESVVSIGNEAFWGCEAL